MSWVCHNIHSLLRSYNGRNTIFKGIVSKKNYTHVLNIESVVLTEVPKPMVDASELVLTLI